MKEALHNVAMGLLVFVFGVCVVFGVSLGFLSTDTLTGARDVLIELVKINGLFFCCVGFTLGGLYLIAFLFREKR